MALLSHSWLFDIFVLIITLPVIIISYIIWCQTYWFRKGLLTPPFRYLFGHIGEVFMQKESFSDLIEKLYSYFKSRNKRLGGLYFLHRPVYLVMDPEIVKHVMQNNFYHFHDRGVYYNERIDPLSAHLFALEGSQWKNLRVKLTPTFTSGKIKMMFDNFIKCSDELIVEMSKNLGKGPLDAKNISERFTTDLIANCAFGIDCNSLKNPDEEYSQAFKSFFIPSLAVHMTTGFAYVFPRVAEKLNLRVIAPALTDFFMKMIGDTVKHREENNVSRKDFLHLLIQLKNRGELNEDPSVNLEDNNRDVISMNQLAAQAFIFFAGGFETSSTTLSFCLYELASNPNIQEKLRAEVSEALQKFGDDITYEAITNMRYMEQVIYEALRKHPPLPGLFRICTKKFRVPGTSFVFEKGTKVWIPVLGLQMDPEYFPNPEKFQPERFSDVNKKQLIPYTFLPFGEGPRTCIGIRFGMMETKVGLCVLLKHYRFSVSQKMSLPVKIDPKSFLLTIKGGIWLDYVKI